ncbi:MAG: GntR family transcriptional regulator [Paracoccus sp. (in: a-proteobacteria)]|nr:GntR family transcriptional regulator [Paracoccus sp. (in: a-proteobacteria)]
MQTDGNGNASDRAYQELRRAIIEGRLPRDQKLTEFGLADRLGISRTPIREAVKRLLLEGFLERRKGQGLWCAQPDAVEVREIFELRLRLESYAAGRAAENATQAQIAVLAMSAERMLRLAGTHPTTPEVIAKIDHENALFHATIVEATQSQRLIHLLRATIDIALVSRTFRQFSPEQRIRSARHHQEIADAIAARSPKWAEQMMQVHILSAISTLDGGRA